MAIAEKTPSKSPIRHRWARQFPWLGQGPIPVEPVVSEAYFEAERERIFRRCWLHVGRVEDIPASGDFFVADIEVARASVLLTRDDRGAINAFHNVCRHRGNKLVWKTRGRSRGGFACNFHGWTYDRGGTLIHVPASENFYEAMKGQCNLRPVAVDTWQGFIFVCLDLSPCETLQEFLGPLYPVLDGFPFDRFGSEFRYRAELDANWKIVMDGQSEIYHVAFLHKDIWPDVFTSREFPYGKNLSMDLYERHRRWSAGAGDFHPTAMQALALRSGPSVADAGDFAVGPVGGINPTGDSTWIFDVVHVFPNLHILVLPGVYHTHQFWPLSQGRSAWEVRVHMPQPKNAAEAFSQEHGKVFLRDALIEDGATNEETQKAIRSGAIDAIHLQDEEIFVRHGYWAVDRAIKATKGETRA